MNEPDPNHPILGDINKWIGEIVDVSNTAAETDWHRATLVGYDKPHFLAKLPITGALSAWKFCRPPEVKRRVPTDRDALLRPKCWVRDHNNQKWKPAILYGVCWLGDRSAFAAYCDDGCIGFWRYCEILVNSARCCG